MTPQAILCPQCGGSDPSREEEDGTHVCTWCGVHYRVDSAGPTIVPAAPPSPRRPWLAGLAVLALVVLGRVGLGQSDPDTQPAVLTPRSTRAQPAPVAQVVPEPAPLTARFAMHRHGSPSSSSFWVFGMLTNTSTVDIGQVEVHAILLDEAGNEIYSDHGYSQDDRLAPGESVPMSILVSSAPAFHGMRFEADPRAPLGEAEDYSKLEITPFEPRRDPFSRVSYSGKVVHHGDEPLRFVQVRVTGFDAEDKVVGISTAFVSGTDALEPGATGRYHMSAISWLDDAVRIETDLVRP